MKLNKIIAIVGTFLLVLSFQVMAADKAVFGEDDRVETVEATKTKYKKWAKSTAAMISNDYIKQQLGTYVIKNELLSEFGVTTSDLMFVRGQVCPEMKYANQIAAANCSAFLVAPNLLMTAGHCVTNMSGTKVRKDLCKKFKWVFGYKLSKDKADKLKSGKLKSVDKVQVAFWDVYTCEEVVYFKNDWMKAIYNPGQSPEELGSAYRYIPHPPKPISYDYSPMNDYALIRLNRNVVGRNPLKVRKEGKIELGERLVVIGHPLGLPSKVTTGGEVLLNEQEHFFNSDIDVFHGNSGSAVFNEATGEIEGILVRGGESFQKDEERECYNIKNSNVNHFEPSFEGDSIEIFLSGINRITSAEELIHYLNIVGR